MKSIIRTTIDPKEIRAKHSSVLVRYEDAVQVTADLEILNEDFDPATKMFTMEIGLHYPRRSAHNLVSLAAPAKKEERSVAIKLPEYMLPQEDFDAIMRDEIIAVPSFY